MSFNQGIGAGGHDHLITGGIESKFGIAISQINDVKKLARKYNLKINGVQQHIGSNVLDEKIFVLAIKKLLETAEKFSDLEFIDFGGGFGIPYKPGEKPLDMLRLGRLITRELERFMKKYGKNIEIKFEPGRYLVAEAGILLATVTDIKKNSHKTFVGIDSGMNQLIRPALYGAYQEIVNASKVKGRNETVSVVGNICESADFFAKDRSLPIFRVGDIVAILDVGASGYSMASFYNGRPIPAEILVEGNKAILIREKKFF